MASSRLATLREGARPWQVQQAQDDAARAQTVLEQSQTTVNEGELRAPADTVVVHRFVEPGQLVTPGQPTLTLAFLDRLYVRTFVPEMLRGRVRPGIEADVIVDAYKDKTFKAQGRRDLPRRRVHAEAGRDARRAREPGLRREGRSGRRLERAARSRPAGRSP